LLRRLEAGQNPPRVVAPTKEEDYIIVYRSALVGV